MEKDQGQKHMCKFCSKKFPCGRSLGGHMRSHLINIQPSDLKENDKKTPKKKLPPLCIDHQPSYKYNPCGQKNQKMMMMMKKKKNNKFSTRDDLLQAQDIKACEECGNTFQSWKALFGHMKCHSTNNSKFPTSSLDEDSLNSCSDHHHKAITDSQSENEAATPSSCKRKRSHRIKRYKSSAAAATNSSSSLTIEVNHHHEQEEEVALSLIILSRHKGDWAGLNSVIESSDNSHFDAKNIEPDSNHDLRLSIKKLRQPPPPRIEAKTRKLDALNNEVVVECSEFEVNSPKNVSKNEFERERKKRSSNSSRKRNSLLSQEMEQSSNSKFACSICKKAFPSYQALGGHRASHKKFKGCCAPRPENSLETENSHNNHSEKAVGGLKRIIGKEHECPICFKVFPSGQALGGQKRTHLVLDQAKNNASPLIARPLPETRGFLDLNLPAPAEEEECREFKPWWIGSGPHQPRPLLGLLYTS